jgi:hypothetical protein
MSFKELNLNKGFNKPKYKEKEKPKLEKEEHKNNSDIVCQKASITEF